MHRHYGAIDIGSNAARLLIKRFDKVNGEISCSKELLLRVPLRLGFDVFGNGSISKDNEKRLMHLVKSYMHLMKIYGVKQYIACATSALRDATNGKSIVKRIKDKTGFVIHIINGEQEARGIYNNHAERSEKGNYMYVDVGGGSTEVSMISNGNLICSNSYNIGTIRILNNVVRNEEWDRLKKDILDLAGMYSGINIIGSGGNINKLYRLIESRDKKRQRITVKSLSDICNVMANMSVYDRVYTFGIKYDRADVIVPAGSIFLAIAELIKAEYIYVPTIGLSDGMINVLFQKDMMKLHKRYKDDDKDLNADIDDEDFDEDDKEKTLLEELNNDELKDEKNDSDGNNVLVKNEQTGESDVNNDTPNDDDKNK